MKQIYHKPLGNNSYELWKDQDYYIFKAGSLNLMQSNKKYFASDTSAIREFKQRFKIVKSNYKHKNEYDIMFKFVEWLKWFIVIV